MIDDGDSGEIGGMKIGRENLRFLILISVRG
jgi:hypothetical protein